MISFLILEAAWKKIELNTHRDMLDFTRRLTLLLVKIAEVEFLLVFFYCLSCYLFCMWIGITVGDTTVMWVVAVRLGKPLTVSFSLYQTVRMGRFSNCFDGIPVGYRYAIG